MYTHGQLKKLYPNGRIVYAGQVGCPVTQKLERTARMCRGVQGSVCMCLTSREKRHNDRQPTGSFDNCVLSVELAIEVSGSCVIFVLDFLLAILGK